ncbi:MAG: phage major capsid protein [Oscillospiraceae bacterium]|nr:phage major capsid protein [Oscillospiraceae bacterium]
MTIQELYAKRATAWEAAKQFLDTHRMENGTLSAEDGATYDRMEAEINDLTNEINRMNRLKELEAAMSQPVNQPLTGKPMNGRMEGEQATGRASKQYVKDMLTAMRSNFRQISNVLEEGNDANGGYLVPDEWDRRLIDVLTEENIFRGLATRITTSGEHKINIAGTKPAASWIEEGGALVFSDATFAQKTLDAHKLHVAIKVTEELLYDNAFNLESYIINQFGKAIGNAEEDAFLNGDGTGKPAGIFDTVKGGTFAVELANTGIKTDDVLTLIYALKRPYRKKASFIMNDSTLAALRKLKDNNGAYIWQPSYQAGEPDRLCGYAVHTSAYCPELEAGKAAIAFGDYSYYNIGDRGTRSLQQLRELFAGNGMIGYVMKERVDGLLVLPEAVQILSVAGGNG